jgi:hypothetical protein
MGTFLGTEFPWGKPGEGALRITFSTSNNGGKFTPSGSWVGPQFIADIEKRHLVAGAYTKPRVDFHQPGFQELAASYITVFFDNRVGTDATVGLCFAETLSVDLQTGQAVSSAA